MPKKKAKKPAPAVSLPAETLEELVQQMAANAAVNERLLSTAEVLIKAGEATAKAANAQLDMIRANRKRLDEMHKKAQEEQAEGKPGPAHPDEGGY